VCSSDLTGKYFLATFHRAENVDNEKTLKSILQALTDISITYKIPVICSIHPKTQQRLDKIPQEAVGDVRWNTPFSFTDFVKLEQNAKCVITDSGTCPEECAIFGVPSVIIRTVTERPELIQTGATVLAGTSVESITRAVAVASTSLTNWNIPIDYMVKDVSNRVIKILLGEI
jgi:UDP-N-acetylglucosamine 2-epimerase (non-hydrolysing)